MNEFFLSPFLVILEESGIRLGVEDYKRICLALRAGGPNWTLSQFRGVLLTLLVRHPEQKDAFERAFDKYFNQALQLNVLSPKELALIWQELEEYDNFELPETPSITNHASPGLELTSLKPVMSTELDGWEDLEVPQTSFIANSASRGLNSASPKPVTLIEFLRFRMPKQQLVFITSTILLFSAVFTVFLVQRVLPSRSDGVAPTASPIISPVSSATVGPSVGLTPQQINPNTGPPIKSNIDWKYWVALVGGLLIAVSYGFSLRENHKLVDEEPLSWNPIGPTHYSLHKIGGKPAPLLDQQTLDQLADSLNYFQGHERGNTLDLEASVYATARQASIPDPVFHRRKQLRIVYVLEDGFAEPLVWNTVPGELVEGLRRRGIYVEYGRFEGSPAKFTTDEGLLVRLEDLDDDRSDSFLLLFSDGKALNPMRDTFVLERLGHWPQVAWMELRERRSWDERTRYVAGFGLAVFQASRHGLLQGFRHFLTERGARTEREKDNNDTRRPFRVTDNAIAVEVLLGDALLWAQACSMIQPCPLGLADILRHTFQPHLPPERIERLLELPGTTLSISGLRFSVPILAVLKTGFRFRWDVHKQKDILKFLMDKIGQTEPSQRDSIEHLSWQWVRGRVHLELDPDAAVKEIARLAQTPLESAIRSELKNIVPVSESLKANRAGPITKIPLRCAPQTPATLTYLSDLTAKSFHTPWRKRVAITRAYWVHQSRQGWRRFRISQQFQQTLALLIAWATFSLTVTPFGSLIIVAGIILTQLASRGVCWFDKQIEGIEGLSGAQFRILLITYIRYTEDLLWNRR